MTREEALGFAADTEVFVSGEVLDETGRLIRRMFDDMRSVLICADDNTFAAAGKRLAASLDHDGLKVEEPWVWHTTEQLEPDTALVPDLVSAIDPGKHVVIAVGSGTINDLVKVACHELGIRYLVVATAPSVDGYTSPGASMLIDGFKQSLYCRAPIGVIADTGVLAAAPPEMLSAGYGDLASKVTAGTDWIIADAVGADAIDPVCWEMIQEELHGWLEQPASIVARNPEALDRVMYGLTLTGIGMQYLRRSRPASGAEHLLSHIWEMNHHRYRGRPVSHGFQVSVGTVAMTAFTECLLAMQPGSDTIDRRLDSWPEWDCREAVIRSQFSGSPGIERIVDENRRKHLTREALRSRLSHVVDRWETLRRDIAARLVPYQTLVSWLADAGCPVSAGDIGLSREALIDTFKPAGMMRDRYTAIDLAWELGLFDSVIEALAESDTYRL